MKKRMIRAGALASIAPVLLAGAAVASSSAPSFEEFEAKTPITPSGAYVVEGDITIGDLSDLRAYYDQNLGSTNPIAEGLIIQQGDGPGTARHWNAQTAKNLSYCISAEFGELYEPTRQAMRAGAAQWEQASSGIKFNHVASEDENCTTWNENVLFAVVPEPFTGRYMARAFFPGYPKKDLNIAVTPKVFADSIAPENVLAHELGHVLGFRHEHIRPEAGAERIPTCNESGGPAWTKVTEYDKQSIMHYPHCNGIPNHLQMSETDREGARIIYGK